MPLAFIYHSMSLSSINYQLINQIMGHNWALYFVASVGIAKARNKHLRTSAEMLAAKFRHDAQRS